ncbi:hypothetical protein [Oleisolibacter albus]|uniref:hypothetical protein n=1 Tax=Oleisolibacter albus TaxID=2171757 RepID=UPI000DF2A725|nr:hypothetical protein [Oleisolibacter albus]
MIRRRLFHRLFSLLTALALLAGTAVPVLAAVHPVRPAAAAAAAPAGVFPAGPDCHGMAAPAAASAGRDKARLVVEPGHMNPDQMDVDCLRLCLGQVIPPVPALSVAVPVPVRLSFARPVQDRAAGRAPQPAHRPPRCSLRR